MLLKQGVDDNNAIIIDNGELKSRLLLISVG